MLFRLARESTYYLSIRSQLQKKKNQLEMRNQVNLHPVDQNYSDIDQASPRKENEPSRNEKSIKLTPCCSE